MRARVLMKCPACGCTELRQPQPTEDAPHMMDAHLCAPNRSYASRRGYWQPWRRVHDEEWLLTPTFFNIEEAAADDAERGNKDPLWREIREECYRAGQPKRKANG